MFEQFLGKMRGKCGMDECEFRFDYSVLIRNFIRNNKIIDTTLNIISEDFVELRYKEKEEMFIGSVLLIDFFS